MLDRRMRSHRGEDDEARAHQHDVLDDVLPLQARRGERSTSRARKKQRTAPDVTRAGGTRPAFSALIVRVARSSDGPRCREERQDAEPAREVERAAPENHGWRMEESSVSATDPR